MGLPVRERFSRADRLRSTREFRAVLKGGERVSGKGLSLFFCRRAGQGRRMGVAVGNRAAAAVSRNRMKRRLREYVRRNRGRMPDGLDLVVVVHRDFSRTDPKTFRAIVGDLFRRAGLLFDPASDDDKDAARACLTSR